MPIQPQLVLLQKTLLNIEGLGRQLYPDLDLWETAKPFLERWMKNQIGPQALINQFKQELPMWQKTLPELPRLLQENVNNQRLLLDTNTQQAETIAALKEQQASMIKQSNRRQLAWLMIAAATSLFVFGENFSILNSLPFSSLTLSVPLAGLGTLLLLLNCFTKPNKV